MPDFLDRAAEFAATLTGVVNGTFSTGTQFVVSPLEDASVAWVWPEGSTLKRDAAVPVTAGLEEGESARLWIRAKFRVSPDKSDRYLQVDTSVMGLCINPETGRCAIRIEYDRARGNEPDDPVPGSNRRSAAHVQIHGVSQELASRSR